MIRSALALIAFVGLAGCANVVSKIIPVGEPVTAERCQKLDLQKIGAKDGQEGQRAGEKFDFWNNDCKSLGVHLDREVYDRGYQDGLRFYCSCEMGFATSVRDETLALKGQYFTCSKPDYDAVSRGYDLGVAFRQDATMVRRLSATTNDYDETKINEQAKIECAKPAAPVLKPESTKKETKSPRPFDPDRNDKKDEASP